MLKPSQAAVESALRADLPHLLDAEGLHHDDVR